MLSLVLHPALVTAEDINTMRDNQEAALDALRADYNNRATQNVPRNPDGSIQTNSPEYRNLHADYNRAVLSTRSQFSAGDNRSAMIDHALGGAFDNKILNTGSVPADVRADVDLAAKDAATAGRLADHWSGQGDKVVYHTIDKPRGTTTRPDDMSRVYKVVNENWDTVVWTPETPEIRAVKLKDPDTFTTQGGQKRTGNVDAARDPRGYYLDNEQKFLHAVHDGDYKTVAKSVSKAGEATGLNTRDADFYDQARALRKYADPVQAGISNLGDSPDVETQKMQDWSLDKAAPQMRAAEIESNRLAQSVDTQRQALIEHARANNDPQLADAIEARRSSIVESNATADARNATMREGVIDSKTPVAEHVLSPNSGETTRVTDLDGPRVEGPDGLRTTDADGTLRGQSSFAPSKGRQALEAGGTAMMVSDGLNLAQDAVDYVEGRMSGTELAESAGLRVPIVGDAYGAGKVVGERASTAVAAWPAVDEANRSIQDSWAQDAAVQAHRGGATTEEAAAIREALAAGNQAEVDRLTAALNQRGVEFEVPEQPGTYRTEPDEGYVTGIPERTGQVLTGIGEQGERAVGFVRDTGSNSAEVASDIIDMAAAEMQAEEQRQNLIGRAVALRRQLEEQGVDPDRALAIAQSFAQGNTAPLRQEREERQQAAEQALRDVEEMAGSDELTEQLLAASDDDSMNQIQFVDEEQYGAAFSSAESSNQELTNEEFVISSGTGRVEVTDLDQVMQQQDALDQAAEEAMRANAATAQAAHEAAWSGTTQGVDNEMITQDQLIQQSVSASQRQGQTLVRDAASRQNPQMSDSDFNTHLVSLLEEEDRLQQERENILTGGQTGAGGPLDPNKGGQYGGAAIAAAVSGNETGFDVRQANCNDVVKSGGNAPASIHIDTGNFGGSATLSFDHYGVKDRIAVISGGGVVFDSGCVPDTGGAALNLQSQGQIRVIVEPNCAQTSSSAWEFRVACGSGSAQQ